MAAETFDSVLLATRRAETKLAAWGKAINDKRKFYPAMKCEWDRAFDVRERLKTKLCRLDRDAYAAMYPDEPNDR